MGTLLLQSQYSIPRYFVFCQVFLSEFLPQHVPAKPMSPPSQRAWQSPGSRVVEDSSVVVESSLTQQKSASAHSWPNMWTQSPMRSQNNSPSGQDTGTSEPLPQSQYWFPAQDFQICFLSLIFIYTTAKPRVARVNSITNRRAREFILNKTVTTEHFENDHQT